MNQKEGRRKGIKKVQIEGDEKEKQKIALKIKESTKVKSIKRSGRRADDVNSSSLKSS